jgi:hypothetical protein
MSNRHQKLADMRREILDQLRAREPELMLELETIDDTIRKLGGEELYTGADKAFEAATNFLGKIMRTEELEVIAQALVDGGFRKGNKYALRNAKNSIQYHLDNSETTKKLKLFPSGRVGLYSWSNDFDHK